MTEFFDFHPSYKNTKNFSKSQVFPGVPPEDACYSPVFCHLSEKLNPKIFYTGENQQNNLLELCM